jgi:alkanesulfonate monooxygenase SsuD/methylene tetrahydromethanopterin reductase-like flavin-dependent oxidoreductase (luciferase family)
MKKISFLSFGHWAPSLQSRTQSATDALLQSIDLAVEAERLGMDGAYFRVHHSKTRKIEIGTAVIDMRYENPHYMAEDAGAADLISSGRLQLGISRSSPEQVIDGWRHLGYRPIEGEDDAGMGRRHAEEFLELLRGKGLLSRTRVQCLPILRDCYVLSRTPKDCAIESRGALLPTRQLCGPRS